MKSLLALILFVLQLTASAGEMADELVERRATTDKAADALLDGNFPELERQVKLYMIADRRSSSGAFKIEQFDDGISEAMTFSGQDADVNYSEMISMTKAWVAEHPASPLAHVLHARALLAYAYHFRGGGYANTVPPLAWASFEKYSKEAAEVLVKSQGVASAYTGWHATMINAARSLGWPRDVVMKVVSDGLARNPDDFRLYHYTLVYLLPKWRGSDSEVGAFIDSAARSTFERHGLEIYARLYSAAAQDQYKHRLFADSPVSWPKMKQGLEDWTSRFPTIWNLNIYAYFACLAKDKAATKVLLEKIGSARILDIWEPNSQVMLSTCQQFANAPVDPVPAPPTSSTTRTAPTT